MSNSIVLTVDLAAEPARIREILSTSDGQRAFWTTDADVTETHARFGFAQAPVDLEADVTVEGDRLVRMHVTSGFPFWDGSTWEWEIGHAARTPGSTGVVFRHYGFGDGYPEPDLGYTAQTWALIQQRLVDYVATGDPQPFFGSR